MKRVLSQFMPGFAQTLVYMLQSTEYQVGPYLRWYWRTKDFGAVMYRRRLVKTKAATLLVVALSLGMAVQIMVGLFLLWYGYRHDTAVYTLLGAGFVVSYPVVWAHLVVLPLWVGRVFIVGPSHARRIRASERIFAHHPGTTIAVAGSYGKTSMKELLSTVLSEGKKVAVTPANKNVPISHAHFAEKLQGDEDILIIEYGEGRPGDVKRFAQLTHPDIGIITGLAPAHLDRYPTLHAAGEDIFSLADTVGPEHLYVNAESEATKAFITGDMHSYSTHTVLGWKVSNIKVSLNGTDFTMKKDKTTLNLHSELLGRHQVGPLALTVALADKFGLSKDQIKAGISKTAPFEHRMQPRALRGAWIIDDTYNGNIDGMEAGLKLLSELPGKRKIYVTPGLVDQGVETKKVHHRLGEAIAEARPDKVVLMHNSSAPYILEGMQASGYKSDTHIEHDPLEFYSNIDHFLASGDVVMMQNDWTDNYN